MIDNTRLAGDQRCAVVLNAFEEERADVTLIYFPGSRASLKEKLFYEDVIPNSQATPNITQAAIASPLQSPTPGEYKRRPR